MSVSHPDPSRLLTRREAAAYIRASLRTVDRLVEDGSLATYSLRGKVLVDPEDLRRLVRPRATGSAPGGGGQP